MLDVFIWGKVRRISPEAPVPVVEVERDSCVPGGAANVANNIRSLGGKVWIAGVVGNDAEGEKLTSQLKLNGVEISPVQFDSNRPTTVKTRIVAHHQQVVRIDREKLGEFNYNDAFLDVLNKNKKSVQAILIEDYGKGIVNQELVTRLIDFARARSIPIGVDPKRGHLLDYRGITFATPNFEEAAYFAGVEPKGDPLMSLDEIGKILIDKWDCQGVLVTLGEKGMCLFERGLVPYRIPTRAREVYDVSGAGDTVIGVFTISLLSGAVFKEAALLANLSAGIVVGKLGTAVVTRDEIERELKNVREE